MIGAAGNRGDDRADMRRFRDVRSMGSVEAASRALGTALDRVTDRQSLLRALDMLRLSYLSHKGSDVILEPGFGP